MVYHLWFYTQSQAAIIQAVRQSPLKKPCRFRNELHNWSAGNLNGAGIGLINNCLPVIVQHLFAISSPSLLVFKGNLEFISYKKSQFWSSRASGWVVFFQHEARKWIIGNK
jgi:hypothetical protein